MRISVLCINFDCPRKNRCLRYIKHNLDSMDTDGCEVKVFKYNNEKYKRKCKAFLNKSKYEDSKRSP